MDFSQDVLPPTLRPPASDTDKENEHTSSAFAIPVGEPSVSEPPRNPSEEPPLRGVPLPAHIVAEIDALLGCATEKPAPEEVHQRHLSLTLPSRRDSPPVATHSAPPQPQGPDVGDKRKLARKKALVLVQQFQQSKRRREEGQTPTHSRTERAEPRTIFEDPLSLRPQPVKESQPQAEERVEEFRAALQEATQPTREKPASPPRALSEAEAAQNKHERERAVEVRAALGAVSQSDEDEEASTSAQVPEDVGGAWPLQSYPSVPTIPSDPLVGRVVKVYWPKYKNYYTGDVTDFDAVTGQHHIAYRDGEMKWTNLREEKWKLTDDVARVPRASPKKQRKASVSKGVTNNSSEGLQIGQRIEVLFDDPPGYFPGTITGKNKGRWQIEYDDGYREELDLSTTGRMDRKYRLLRGEGLIAGPKAHKAAIPTKRKGTRPAWRGPTLQDLIKAGLMEPGQGVLRVEYKGHVFLGDLTPEGSIFYEGELWESPTSWSIHVKRRVSPGMKVDNGWESVFYVAKDGGEIITLKQLRSTHALKMVGSGSFEKETATATKVKSELAARAPAAEQAECCPIHRDQAHADPLGGLTSPALLVSDRVLLD